MCFVLLQNILQIWLEPLSIVDLLMLWSFASKNLTQVWPQMTSPAKTNVLLGVKEAAAWALGYIAHHNDELAQVKLRENPELAIIKQFLGCSRCWSSSNLGFINPRARAFSQACCRLRTFRHLQALSRTCSNCCWCWRHCSFGPNDSKPRC